MHHFFSSLVVLALASSLAACSPVVVGPDEILGTIVDGRGAPVASVNVTVGDAIVTTDAEGRFEIDAAPRPYDLTAFLPNSSARQSFGAGIFVGLVDREPTIKLFDEIAFPFATEDRNANVLVSFAEKDDDSTVSRIILDRIGGADMPSRWWAQGANSANPPPHSVNLQWIGAPSITARIQAFRYTVDPVTKGPKHYVGYDSADITLVDGPPTTFAVSWKPPPFGESTISLSLHRSPGQDSVTAYLGLQAGALTSVQPFASVVTKASEVSFVVPDLPGAPFSAMAEAIHLSSLTTANVPGLAAGAKGVILEIPPSIELIGLNDKDPFGVGSTFQWSSQGTDASFLRLSTSPGENNGTVMSYFVSTQGHSMVVPDLGKLGIDLPPGVEFSIVAQSYSTNPTVDDLAADPTAHEQLSAPSRYATSELLRVFSQ